MANPTTQALPPEWVSALRKVETRRSKLHYKPAALLVMLDILDENPSASERIPFREYNERFHDLVRQIDLREADNGWEPFLHLATGNQIWGLYRDGRNVDLESLLTNRTRASVEAGVDEARIRPELFQFLRERVGREAIRGAVLRMLADDKPGDSHRLRDAYLAARNTGEASTVLTVGSIYTRDDLARMFDITDATLNTGIFQPKGTRSIWIFVTERKTPDRTQYEDHLDGDVLHWQGQTEGRKDALIIEHVERNFELLVFHRQAKYEHAGAGFRYEGEFEHVSHKGSKPTNFVLRRVASRSKSPEVSDALNALSEIAGRKRRGQGFHTTPEARSAIEQHAMQKVEEYYREHGWAVDSSAAKTECFDLRCTKGSSELHVEVKGTTSLGEEIVLTRNEVLHARQQYPALALAIVRNIQIEAGDPPQATGGELGIIEPWRIDDGTLECLAFSYEVPITRISRPRQ